MKLLIIFAISAVLLQYHFAATAGKGGDEANLPSQSKQKSWTISELPNYEIGERIGKGSFAKVYSAIHIPTGEEVAIKAIDKSKLNEHLEDNIFREPDHMEQFNHPNIVRLFQVHDTDKFLYLVMEKASGGDLVKHVKKIKNGRMTEEEVRYKFRQIISAVQYIHKKNIVHRDLKTENVLLDRSKKNIKLADFGFSNEFTEDFYLDTFCGSPCYTAPESLRDEDYDGPCADVWSLGVILHEMISSSLPFDCESVPDLLKNINKGYRVPNFASPLCKDLLRKILVIDPEDRLSVKEIMEDPWMNIGHENVPLEPYEPKPDPNQRKEIKEALIKKDYKEEEIEAAIDIDEYDSDVYAAYLILQRKRLNSLVFPHSGGTASQSHKRSAPSPNSSTINKKKQTAAHGKPTQ